MIPRCSFSLTRESVKMKSTASLLFSVCSAIGTVPCKQNAQKQKIGALSVNSYVSSKIHRMPSQENLSLTRESVKQEIDDVDALFLLVAMVKGNSRITPTLALV